MHIKITDNLETTRRWIIRLTSPVVNIERLPGTEFKADDMQGLDELNAFTGPGRELMAHLGLFVDVTVYFDPEDACKVELEPAEELPINNVRGAFRHQMEAFMGSWTVRSHTTTGIDWM